MSEQQFPVVERDGAATGKRHTHRELPGAGKMLFLNPGGGHALQ